MSTHDLPETKTYSRWAVLASAVGGFVVAALATWWATGNAVFYEELFRIAPTVEGGGVGTDWVAGNTVPVLDFAIALVHAADFLMGVFILFMVFVHWGAFRRLAGRMRSSDVVTDGGTPADRGRPADEDRPTDESRPTDEGRPEDGKTPSHDAAARSGGDG
ncbi:hypothetical protein [Salinirarus marinus]|uniref:hypothetical protein n=2 Tax=Haloferacaceae TaxID=1644056 RepID=UPI003C6C1024